MALLLLFLVLFLAFSNGANDNFKGVATLYGSGVVDFKKAVFWSTTFTLLGVLLAVFYADHLVKMFAGKGLVSDQAVQSLPFIASVVFASGITVIFATRIGMPISTTHALIGGLVGAGLSENPGGVEFSYLSTTFLLPLLLSPVAAMLVALLIRFATRYWTFNGSKSVARLTHWLSGFAVCAMRGMNDAPKMAGMLFLVPFVGLTGSLIAIGTMMAAGGILYSKKVANTLSKKLVVMNEPEGTVASFATFLLLGLANIFSLPVSTTHVNVGSIYGVSLLEKKGQNKTLIEILKSWLLTMPFAAVVAFGLFKLLLLIE